MRCCAARLAGRPSVRAVARAAALAAAWLAWAAPAATCAATPAETAPAPAAQSVQVPSLDAPRGGAPVQLPAAWYPARTEGRVPALVLLHGCGGLHDRSAGSIGSTGRAGRAAREAGQSVQTPEAGDRGMPPPGARYTELAAFLNGLGIHVLVTDSLTPRGERELCTQRTGQRRVTQLQRRRDALGALQWLAAQPGVDAVRLGLLGWSNGGSTVLAATNLAHNEVARAATAGVRAGLAVAFYPGCEAELQRGYRPAAPLLLLLGEADDWTAAAPCKQLAAQAQVQPGVAAPQFEAYAGAYHGFDGTAPLRLRRDVPNGVNPGAGVHVGAHPEARAAARQRLEAFLRHTWNLAP